MAVMTTYDTPGPYTFVVPEGVTSLSVAIWGAGGAGGLQEEVAANTFDGGAGGGGGACAFKGVFPVTPGETLDLQIGSGSDGDGGDSYIKRGETFLMGAEGGQGATGETPGAGGYLQGPETYSITPDYLYAGADGGAGATNIEPTPYYGGGGGGGAGGILAAGTVGQDGPSGAAGAGGDGGGTHGFGFNAGGAGGAGAFPTDNAFNGQQPGGGGGGAATDELTLRGDGGQGMIQIYYEDPVTTQSRSFSVCC